MKSLYVCIECGFESPKWMGRCIKCGQWDTMKETENEVNAKVRDNINITKLNSKSSEIKKRITTGFSEFDRVLGGGLVPGEVILIGGEPGIGKTSLLLKLVDNVVHSKKKAVYVSAEESLEQLQVHASRLSVSEDLDVIIGNDVDSILARLNKEKKDLVVIDSIQTIKTEDLRGVIGGIGQVKETTSRLVDYAKSKNCSIIVVGHITKQGGLAGPKTVEHIVDAVLHLYGDPANKLRFLKASKNRFGSTDELGVFSYTGNTYSDIKDPSQIFVLSDKPMVGTCRGVVFEGRRGIIVEVQALTTKSSLSAPQRVVSGLQRAKIQMLCALLTKYTKTNLIFRDVYANLANGLKANDSSLDLSVCLSLISSFWNKKVHNNIAAVGEVSLTGQILPTIHNNEKVDFLIKQGYKKIFVSSAYKVSKNFGQVIKRIDTVVELERQARKL